MATGPIDPGKQNRAPRPRLGCLGCLGKLFVYLIGILLLGAALVLAIDAVFAPWSFYMGGRFHPIPMWRGWGKIHSASGHDYVLYVWLEPYRPRRGRGGTSMAQAGVARVEGRGELCTPRGEHYNVRVTGSMEKNMGSSTDGKRMDMRAYRRPWYATWTGKWDSRPDLEFHGAWHNPDLVVDDHGSLDRAFDPDGTLHSGPGPARTPGEPGVPLTLHEGDKPEFEAACADVQGPGRLWSAAACCRCSPSRACSRRLDPVKTHFSRATQRLKREGPDDAQRFDGGVRQLAAAVLRRELARDGLDPSTSPRLGP